MNIIINGGTRGIGRDLALSLADDPKNKILITGRNESALNSLSKLRSNIITYQVDLSEFESHSDSLRDFITKNMNNIDILINMAGTLVSEKFDKTKETDARKMMEVNFFGTAFMIRLVKPFMKKGSHVVNISSMGGFQGSVKFEGLSFYSASKAALANLSECLAVEYSSAGISVNCLALGAVQTAMLEEAFPGYQAPVSSEEMAKYIADFAIHGNRYFNGKVIPVAVNNP
jgi:short-subunit dehydrogenase